MCYGYGYANANAWPNYLLIDLIKLFVQNLSTTSISFCLFFFLLFVQKLPFLNYLLQNTMLSISYQIKPNQQLFTVYTADKVLRKEINIWEFDFI